MNEPMWIPFPKPITMVVEFPFQGMTGKAHYVMLAWRWNNEIHACQYLEVNGCIWKGKYGREVGVVGVAEDDLG